MEFVFGLFFLIPIIVFCAFIFSIGKGIAQWSYNNSQPVLTSDSKIVGKRSAVGGSVHDSDGNVQTAFFVTFQLESGERLEFQIDGKEYGLLCEADSGALTYQGTRYKGFKRTI